MSIIFPFQKEVIDKAPESFAYLQTSSINKFVSFIINSNYRDAVNLKGWIKEQIESPSDALVELADNISNGKEVDETVINVLQAVVHLLKYEGDQNKWHRPDYWQRADETLYLRTGDCEDGAILQYVLCRIKGVPANRLLLFCGDVQLAGHCWLAYRPTCYPLNFVFLDWCYWPSEQKIGIRNFYYIKDQIISGEELNGDIDIRYKKIWFGFNEDHSLLSMKYNFPTTKVRKID